MNEGYLIMNYELYNNSYNGAATGMAIVMLVVMLITLLLGIISYIIYGWSLMQVARDNGKPSWMGWVPLANIILLFQVNGASPAWLLLLIVPFVNFGVVIYTLVLLYKLVDKYKTSKVLFWFGLIILPCTLVMYVQIGKSAKNGTYTKNKSSDGSSDYLVEGSNEELL